MPFRLSRRESHRGDTTVLGTYAIGNCTVRVLRTEDDRIEWTCDCGKRLRHRHHGTPLWCKHIAKAAALRSLQRLTARRLGAAAAGGPLTPR